MLPNPIVVNWTILVIALSCLVTVNNFGPQIQTNSEKSNHKGSSNFVKVL